MNICCPKDVLSGKFITPEKRRELFGRIAGGSGSSKPENYQRQKVAEGTGTPCIKTNTRIHYTERCLKELPRSHVCKQPDWLSYSEDFDGVQRFGPFTVYINFKCISGSGGSQLRSIREVFHFIKGQLDVLLKNTNESLFFANILDGDEADARMENMKHLLSLPEYADVSSKVYIGDLKHYFDWLIYIS